MSRMYRESEDALNMDDADRFDIETMSPADWDHDDDGYYPSWDDISGKLFEYGKTKLAVAMERKAQAIHGRAKTQDEYAREYAAWYLRIAPRFGLTEGIKTAEQYLEPAEQYRHTNEEYR